MHSSELMDLEDITAILNRVVGNSDDKAETLVEMAIALGEALADAANNNEVEVKVDELKEAFGDGFGLSD